MRIHRDGKNIIIASLIILTIINTTFIIFFPINIFYISIFFSLIILVLFLQFFRNPKRIFSGDKNCINSPADGKILKIEKIFENEYFNREMLKISIFMSITNVHLNRIPISGRIIYTKYHPGKYLVAFHPKSSELNERNTIVIEDDLKNQILVRQIAGAFARRICSYTEINNKVIIGDELGFIKFGSRVDLFLPENVRLNIVLNQKVFANRTIIGFLT